MFFSRKKLGIDRVLIKIRGIWEFLTTYSNTELSFWSPQIRISVIDLKLSTNSPLLFSDTVVFFSKTVYRYFRCVKDSLLRVDCDERNQLLMAIVVV